MKAKLSKTGLGRALATLVFAGTIIVGCDSGDSSNGMGSGNNRVSDGSTVYPVIADANNNGINDYVEKNTHASGPSATKTSAVLNFLIGAAHAADTYPHGAGLYNHSFIDTNNDEICDYAQNGSNTWHGPGFIDENKNGVCDYWEPGTLQHNKHEGMWFLDQNGNVINDFFEETTHQGGGHLFNDSDGDGICDDAQNGTNTWHGPNFVDADRNGICDHWQSGGRGHHETQQSDD